MENWLEIQVMMPKTERILELAKLRNGPVDAGPWMLQLFYSSR